MPSSHSQVNTLSSSSRNSNRTSFTVPRLLFDIPHHPPTPHPPTAPRYRPSSARTGNDHRQSHALRLDLWFGPMELVDGVQQSISALSYGTTSHVRALKIRNRLELTLPFAPQTRPIHRKLDRSRSFPRDRGHTVLVPYEPSGQDKECRRANVGTMAYRRVPWVWARESESGFGEGRKGSIDRHCVHVLYRCSITTLSRAPRRLVAEEKLTRER